MSLPELLFSPPEGGTIHKYELIGGKRLFMRFISCYLGKCKFNETIEDANNHLEEARSHSLKKHQFWTSNFVLKISSYLAKFNIATKDREIYNN